MLKFSLLSLHLLSSDSADLIGSHSFFYVINCEFQMIFNKNNYQLWDLLGLKRLIIQSMVTS